MFAQEDANNDFEEELEQYQIGYLHAIDDVQRKIKLRNRDITVNKGRFNQNQPSSNQHKTEKKNERQKDHIVYKESTNNHSNYTNNFEPKESIKCWECNGPHYASVCPNWKKIVSDIHTIQEEMIVGDLVRKSGRINAALEKRQADYQTSMVEVEGKLNQIPISILIDPRASYAIFLMI